MENKRTFSDMFVEHVMKVVYKVLRKESLLISEWRLGKVESVISPSKIKAYIDGGNVAQTIAANPNEIFEIGDEIWVICPRNSVSKFALTRRGLNYTNPPIDSNIEVSNARTDTRGKQFTTLKGRLDSFDLEFGERGINVKWFGAKGDGVTDDTTAIQNAINASPVGSVIFFPAGTYMISAILTFLPNRTYSGVGWGSTIKQMNDKHLAQMVNLGDEVSQHPNIIIQDLQFDGNRDYNNTTVGLYLFGLLNSMIYRVRVQNCGGTGIFLEGNETIQSSTNHLVDCWLFSNTGYGIYFSGACADNHIIGGDMGANWNCAVYIAGVSSSMRDATLWGTQSGSCCIVAGVSNQLTGNNIEGAAGHGVEILASHNYVQGNKIYDNANVPDAYGNYDGVYINGGLGNEVENVIIEGNTIYAGLYESTGYYRYAVNLDTYHKNCEVNGNSVRYARSNGVINNTQNPINGLKESDVYNGMLLTTSTTRPTANPLGQHAYDLTLQKEIIWNGTAWRDVMGNAV